MSIRTIYCHGLPGSPSELGAFGAPQLIENIHALERLSRNTGNYERDLLAAFDALDLKEQAAVAQGGRPSSWSDVTAPRLHPAPARG